MSKESHCNIPTEPDYTGVQIISPVYSETLLDYRQAMGLANEQASKVYDDYMLLSWYDRDRNFESPQHASECHVNSAIPGYIDYALFHGAKLKVDIEQGRFVFFYLLTDFDQDLSRTCE
ncbi:hypothetical protein MNBD_GAMMA11-2804 [hydrothermal vent metagenome]|uniref:DUF5619 domain-containing protein n=1 Tax=hydrothermal vent metagenome TaxID=652676 RepID=A0A3B0XXI4_9ZZZZ